MGWHLQGEGTALSPWCVREELPRGWDPPGHPLHSPSPPFVPAASAGLLENCTGCVLCSEDNGCITCHHRLFLLIWRDGIRQYGMCVHTCPPGYFGVRGLEVNRCTSTSRVGVPLLPSPPCGSRRCGKGDGFASHSIPGGSRAGRAGGALSPFPSAGAAARSPQVLGLFRGCPGLSP